MTVRTRLISPLGRSGDYTQPNPRGCPGSYAKVRGEPGDWGVCPFCNQDKRIRKDGTLKAHARPSH